jgi:hypothetical protein
MSEVARVKAEHIEGFAQRVVSHVSDIVLAEHNFMEVSKCCFECLRCRTVPMAFRVANSVSMQRPTVECMLSHATSCKGDAFELTNVVEAIEQCLVSNSELSLEKLEHPELSKVVSIVTGNAISCKDTVYKAALNMMKRKASGNPSEGSGSTFSVDVSSISRPSIESIFQLYAAFEEFAQTVPRMESSLLRHPDFVRLFHLISPFLIINMDKVKEYDSHRSNSNQVGE